MGIFNMFSDFFNKDPDGKKGLLTKREEIKNRFKIQLKNKFFMTDEEIKIVIAVVEEYEKRRDKVQEGFNLNEDSQKESELMVKKLDILQKEMEAELKEIINYIMHEKLKIAKELKKKREEGLI